MSYHMILYIQQTSILLCSLQQYLILSRMEDERHGYVL